MLMRWSKAARYLHRVVSVGASDSPESIWNPSCTQKASGKHQRTRYPAEGHCAAIQFLGPAVIQLLPPCGVTAAIAERCMPWIAEGRQINLEGSSLGTAMNGQTSSPRCDRALQ